MFIYLFSGRALRFIRYLIVAASVLLLLFFAAELLLYYNQQLMQQRADERLNLYESTLKLQLSKYSYLPFLVAESSPVTDLLAGKGSVEEVNIYLQEVSDMAGATAVYLLDSKGVVFCASNWNLKNSYVGLDLSFRPYFKASIKGKSKRFYGVGLAAEQPGYYISYPIMSGKKVKGVAVVKIDLSRLQNLWVDGGENLFVADSNGIIILSSRPEWRYKTLAPLSSKILKTIQEGGQFPESSFKQLNLRRYSFSVFEPVRIDNDFFIERSRKIDEVGWTISYLSGVKPLLDQLFIAFLTLLAFIGAILVVRMFFRERRFRRISKRQAEEAHKIQRINQQLEQEVRERKRTEQELLQAQEELVEAGKLAALGEMATAVAHELNQPIAALKMYIASCRLMVKRKDCEKIDSTLQNVLGISDRMAKVTEQLKSYARKSIEQDVDFRLFDAINEIQALMKHQFRQDACAVRLGESGSDLYVHGDVGRFEQVLINLFRNALDAMAELDEKFIEIGVMQEDSFVVLKVRDNGPGLDPVVVSRIFEPFVTTKKEGVGLGLGLSISYKIIKEMGGLMWAENHPDGGAVFFLKLPICQSPEV